MNQRNKHPSTTGYRKLRKRLERWTDDTYMLEGVVPDAFYKDVIAAVQELYGDNIALALTEQAREIAKRERSFASRYISSNISAEWASEYRARVAAQESCIYDVHIRRTHRESKR